VEGKRGRGRGRGREEEKKRGERREEGARGGDSGTTIGLSEDSVGEEMADNDHDNTLNFAVLVQLWEACVDGIGWNRI
jgi:hypothetical protein